TECALLGLSPDGSTPRGSQVLVQRCSAGSVMWMRHASMRGSTALDVTAPAGAATGSADCLGLQPEAIAATTAITVNDETLRTANSVMERRQCRRRRGESLPWIAAHCGGTRPTGVRPRQWRPGATPTRLPAQRRRHPGSRRVEYPRRPPGRGAPPRTLA